MNERLKQLAEQCRIEEYNQHGDLIEFGFNEEKFAELIVRECVAQFCRRGAVSADGTIVMEIKQHFGVE
jgi:hypothetical protein